MKNALSKINHFLAYSRWIMPLYFYVCIPLLIQKSSISNFTILAVGVLSFVWVWRVKQEWYQRFSRFLFDMVIMALGLILLYCVEMGIFDVSKSHAVLILLSYLTNVPAVMSAKRFLQ